MIRLSRFKIIDLLSGIVLLSTFSGAQAQMDVSITHLNAEQRAFIQNIYPTELPPNNQGFDLLAGFAADVDQDPQQQGAKWIAQVRADYANTQQQDSISPPASDLAKALRKDMTALCPDFIACERELLHLPPEQALALLKKYTVFLDRYNTYLKMPNHVYALPHSVNTSYPNYQQLSYAHRLSLLQLIFDFNHTNNDIDRNNLLSNYLKKQTKLLADKESLIGNMVAINIISSSINIASLLGITQRSEQPLFLYNLDGSKHTLCHSFKNEMQSIYSIIKKNDRENSSIYFFMTKIDEIINHNSKKISRQENNFFTFNIPEKIKYKFSIIQKNDLYDHNSTDILYINHIMQACILSELSLAEYISTKNSIKNKELQHMEDIESRMNELALYINKTNNPLEKMPQHNMAGEYFMTISKPDLTPYIERKFIINAKINLINLLIKEQPEKITQAWLDQQQAARHPIIENATAQLDVEKQVICFDIQGTDADSKKTQQTYNCLPI